MTNESTQEDSIHKKKRNLWLLLRGIFEKPVEKKKEQDKPALTPAAVSAAEVKKEEGPKILIPQRVIKKLIAGTELYEATETGEAIIGIVVPPDSPEVSEPTIYVLDTIAPDDLAIRQSAYFETGDNLQADIFVWLSKNWEEMRKSGLVAPEFNYPLKHLGDWHKHPELLRTPSDGDLETAKNFLHGSGGMSEIIVPITTYRTWRTKTIEWNGQKLLIYDKPSSKITFSFSYLSRKMLDRHEKSFLRVQPSIVADNLVPELPPVSWHLKNQKRFRQELFLLKDYKCRVSVLTHEMNGTLPMELCLAIQKQGWRNRVLAVTDAEYPNVAPEIKVFDYAGVEIKRRDMFSWIPPSWKEILRLHAREPNPDKFLIQHIWELEQGGKL